MILKLINMTDAGFRNSMDRLQRSRGVYSGKEWRQIAEHITDVRELMATAKKSGHVVFPEQINALIDAYRASDQKDWNSCQHWLREFFEWEIPNQIWEYDLSMWDIRHLIRWHYMLLETDIHAGKPTASSRFFHLLVKEQISDKVQPV
jgi:hypothetical protein